MGRLTKANIVTRALELVGNTAIQARGELWCDLLLDHLARAYRWPELQKQHAAAIGAGTSTVAYPTDYGSLVYNSDVGGVGVFQDSTGGRTPVLELVAPAARSTVDHTTDGAGTPAFVGDDRNGSRWILHPISNVAGTLYLEYSAVPVTIVSTGIPWYPNDLALVNALVDIAERHERGTMVSTEKAIADQAARLALGSPSRLKLWMGGGRGDGLDPRFFHRGGG